MQSFKLKISPSLISPKENTGVIFKIQRHKSVINTGFIRYKIFNSSRLTFIQTITISKLNCSYFCIKLYQ